MTETDREPNLSRIDLRLRDSRALLESIDSRVTEREAAFLLQAAAMPTCAGAVLEIGAHLGKATVALARGADLAGEPRISTIDPAPCRTFLENLRRAAIAERVQLIRRPLAEAIDQLPAPIRLCWHDGPSDAFTVAGDLARLRRHLADGAVVALHHALSLSNERAFVFAEGVLADEHFGACGMVGSIGWAQFHHHAADARVFAARKQRLQRQLRRLQQFHRDVDPTWLRKMHYRALRALVPHQRIGPEDWQRQVA